MPKPDYDKRTAATLKKLRALARSCYREAENYELAAHVCVADDGLHAKKAAKWRGRSRTCWNAIALISETRGNIQHKCDSSQVGDLRGTEG